MGHRPEHDLGARAQAQMRHDPPDLDGHAPGRHAQPRGDLGIGVPIRDEPHDLTLEWRQRGRVLGPRCRPLIRVHRGIVNGAATAIAASARSWPGELFEALPWRFMRGMLSDILTGAR